MTPAEIDQLRSLLIPILSDGFNRSIGALEKEKAINLDRLNEAYSGIGSRYYDIVSEQLEYTARYGAESISQYLDELQEHNEPKDGSN
ncbi:MAG: hypothetical protein AAGA96_10100 [Verrucomicrobiota bacterium]